MNTEKLGWRILAIVAVGFLLAAMGTGLCGCASPALRKENALLKQEVLRLRAELREQEKEATEEDASVEEAELLSNPRSSASNGNDVRGQSVRPPMPAPPTALVAPPVMLMGPAAQLYTPLPGCESGVNTVSIRNDTRFDARIWIDGKALTPIGANGPAPFVKSGVTIFTCLTRLGLRLGTHRVDAEYYEWVDNRPHKIGCSTETARWDEGIGKASRQYHHLEWYDVGKCM